MLIFHRIFHSQQAYTFLGVDSTVYPSQIRYSPDTTLSIVDIVACYTRYEFILQTRAPKYLGLLAYRFTFNGISL